MRLGLGESVEGLGGPLFLLRCSMPRRSDQGAHCHVPIGSGCWDRGHQLVPGLAVRHALCVCVKHSDSKEFLLVFTFSFFLKVQGGRTSHESASPTKKLSRRC